MKKERKRVQLNKDQHVAILERVKKGATFPEITKAMRLKLLHVHNQYYCSELPEVVNYRAKKELKKKRKSVQVKEEQQQKKD